MSEIAPRTRAACPCGGGCPRCTAALGATSGPEEAQADRIAAAVMGGSTSLPAAAPDIVRDAAPLPAELRRFYEPRFARSLADVKLHTGPAAQAETHARQAHAFTHDRHIWLGRDRPAAPSLTLAHELAHAVHHDRHTVWLEPYHTRGIALDRAQIGTMAGRSYWEQRTITRYLVSLDNRLGANPEERDAVLAVLWSLPPPASVARRQVMTVPIAARPLPPPPAAAPGAPASAPGASPAVPAPTSTPELIYRFVFEPPAPAVAGTLPDRRPRLSVEFVASGTGLNPTAAPAAPAGFVPSEPSVWRMSGFDAALAAPTDYWTQHPDEHRALFNWIQNSAPATFDQVVTTTTERSAARGAPTVTHRSAFRVSGSHVGSTIANVTIRLISETELAPQRSAAADYRGHGDAGDFEFERLRARTPAADALGSVTLPATLPADETAAVKVAVRQYFEAGRARNTEVDAIVPVGPDARSVLFTLNFGSANNVTVTRVGEAGVGTGLVDTTRIDVRRVRGFPAAPTAATLRSWWAGRYAAAGALTSPATADPAALTTEMNGLINTGAAAAGWFNTVYGIEVMDAAATTTRLTTTHHVPAARAGGTIAFSTTDLHMLELGLQTLTSSELTRLRGVKLGRRTDSLTRNGNRYAAGGANQYGLTLTDGSDTTVLYFQALYLNDASLFRGGGAATALPDVTMGLLHELGHATEDRGGIEAAFNTWLAANPQPAPTWYAASAGSELFPEAWALYHTDPHFLCGSAPLLFAWLDALATSGTAPAATAVLAAPATCPA